ncbi:MAG TPA: gliding motility-associated C-terminal domain-containing protein [Flavipsychrobacter sp.]|nr:gliding motility-associated C-terminal domain-containing protein [Flavipsychrobacter sp.]
MPKTCYIILLALLISFTDYGQTCVIDSFDLNAGIPNASRYIMQPGGIVYANGALWISGVRLSWYDTLPSKGYIYKYDLSGNKLDSISYPVWNFHFMGPMAVDSQYLWTKDYEDTIYKFSLATKSLVAAIPGHGHIGDYFSSIAENNDTLYFIDDAHNTCFKFVKSTSTFIDYGPFPRYKTQTPTGYYYLGNKIITLFDTSNFNSVAVLVDPATMKEDTTTLQPWCLNDAFDLTYGNGYFWQWSPRSGRDYYIYKIGSRLSSLAPLSFVVNTTNTKCHNDSTGAIKITVTDGSGKYDYSWSNGSAADSISGLPAGKYYVTVNDTISGRKAIDSVIVSEPLSVAIEYNVDNETCAGADGKITLNVTGGTTPYTYAWSGNFSGNYVQGLSAGNYAVRITDSNNCETSTVISVGKEDCDAPINIHNVITPNGDGINDVFTIEGISNYPSNSLSIIDKWGDVVYQQNDYKNTWAGTAQNGRPLSSGTYYYVLKLNLQKGQLIKSSYTGYIMIER